MTNLLYTSMTSRVHRLGCSTVQTAWLRVRSIHIYYADTGSREDGKINVKFSPNGDNPSFQIEDSYKIDNEDDQRAILEYIMNSSYYSQDVYNRTIDSMLIEWDAHNDIYLITRHERVRHTDFDKNDEGVGYWEFWWRGIKEIFQ